MLRIVAIWLLLAGLAIANGALREIVLVPAVGSYPAHCLSTLLLVVLVLAVSGVSLRFLRIETPDSAWRVGAIWLLLTLGFEFLAGHFLFGNPWSKIFHDYNLAAGRVWIFVPLATIVGPRLMLGPRRNVQNGA